MRGKTFAVWMAVLFLSCPWLLVADTVDDLAAAAMGTDEARGEAATAAAMADKDFNVGRACAKVTEYVTEFEKAEQKRQEALSRGIKLVLTVLVDKSGAKELAVVVPKLIEIVNKGGVQCTVVVESAISTLCVHGFSDADYKAQATAIDNWDDHKKMWLAWWSANGSKPHMALVMGGFARAGVKLDLGDKSDGAFDSMMQVLINALGHDQVYIRANAGKLLRTGCFGGIETPWGFDPEAPQAERQKSIDEARKMYAANKPKVMANLRGGGK